MGRLLFVGLNWFTALLALRMLDMSFQQRDALSGAMAQSVHRSSSISGIISSGEDPAT